MIEIAVGRACHFCGVSPARNVRLRRKEGETEETFTAPLCPRHLVLLQSAGPEGRLHKPTGVRWWLVEGGAETVTPLSPMACPADLLLDRRRGPAR